MIKLAITGCLGRMGRSITQLALDDEAFHVTTLLEYKNHPAIVDQLHDIKVQTDPSVIKGNDVLIDFTAPESTMENIKICGEHGIKMVIGTTGFTDEHFSKIKTVSSQIPIVLSGNMSTGVNLMFKLTETLAQKTPAQYVASITEAHHTHKKDAPSGTAKILKEKIEMGTSRKITETESIRQGEIIGNHSVTFESQEDIITISHQAKTRDIFAKGALVAAKFLIDKGNGLYNMQDVLNLN